MISFYIFLSHSFCQAEIYKWGTVHVNSSTPELTEGQYDIYLQFNGNPPVTIGNFSPVISQDTLPNLNSIYLYHQIHQLTASANSIDIMMNAEGFAYVYNRDAYNRVFLLALGADILNNYSFYDPNLNRNILYYSLSARDTTFLDHRFSYYLSVIREMVYQNTITRANTIGPEINRLAEGIDFVQKIYGLTEKATLIYKLVNRYAPNTAGILQALNEANSDSILAIMQNDISDKSLDDLQQGVNYILEKLNSTDAPHKYLGAARKLDRLTKGIDALKQINALLTAAPLTIDVIVAWFTFHQNLDVFIERFQALESFFNSYRDMIMVVDPQIVFAFDHFKTNEFANLGPYVFFNAITLDNFKNLISLTEYFVGTLSSISIPLSLALWTAKDSLFELIEDINAVNYTTASYTFLKVLQDYLRDKIESLGRSGSIIYEDASKILTSMQMFLAQSYSIDVTFREITCFNFASPADWLIFFAFGGREVLDKVCTDSQYFENETQRYLQIIGGKASFADVIHSDSHPFERPGNFTFIESKIKDKNIIVVNLGPIQSTYQPNDTVTLSVNLEDVFEVTINDVSVVYNIKNNSNTVVKSGTLSPLGNGQYQVSFNAPDTPGNYTIEVTATKAGYQDGFVTASFTVNQPDPRLDAGLVGLEWTNPQEDDFQIDINESISVQVVVKNYGTIKCNIPIILELVGAGRSSTNWVFNVEPGQSVGSTQISLSTSGLENGFYTIQVRTDLSGDSNSSNNSVTRNILIGQQTIIPNRLPLQSYKLYQRTHNGTSQITSPIIVSLGGVPYTITAKYLNETSAWFDISGLPGFQATTGNLYSIDIDQNGNEENDKLFIALYSTHYISYNNTYYIEFQVGIYDDNPIIQQLNPHKVVTRTNTCSGYLADCPTRSRAKYDYYTDPGQTNYYAYLHSFDPILSAATLNNYICMWTYNDKNFGGGDSTWYGGSLVMGHEFLSSGRIPEYYNIVPSPSMPKGDYDLIIIQEQKIDLSGSDIFKHLGYAHSVRMHVIDYHEAEVTSIVLPPSMRSGGSYTVHGPGSNKKQRGYP